MSIDLGRRLIVAGLVSPEEVEAALFLSVARGVPFPRVLLDRGAITERGLEDELERVGGLGLRQVAGAPEVVARLPRALCRRLAALPTRVDPETGTVDVAAGDPLDPHVGSEFGFHLGAPIRVLRAPIAAVEEAIRRLELDDTDVTERARPRRMTPPFPHGAPQSSIPPPVLDETPIPLVRKVGAGAEGGRTGGTLVPPAGAPPLARLGVTAPRPFGAITVAPHTAPYPGRERPPPERVTPVHEGHEGARATRLPIEPPAVSFPSLPPEGQGDRITPPYGTPIYDPGAAGKPQAPAATAAYRVAPPAEDPLALGRAVAEIPLPPSPSPSPPPLPPRSPPPAKPTLMSAHWPPGPRPPARPPLGDVPYPAAVGLQTPGSRRGALPDEEEDDDGDVPFVPVPKHRVRAPDGGPVLEALQQVTSRDEVIRLAMRGMRLVARRLAVFAAKRDGFYGWSCNVELGEQEALRALKIPAEQPSVLATAAATAIYLGPIPATPAHEGLLRVMERASSDVAAVAVRVAGRPALVLLCDELEDTMTGTRFLGELGRAVGEALTRLIVR